MHRGAEALALPLQFLARPLAVPGRVVAVFSRAGDITIRRDAQCGERGGDTGKQFAASERFHLMTSRIHADSAVPHGLRRVAMDSLPGGDECGRGKPRALRY